MMISYENALYYKAAGWILTLTLLLVTILLFLLSWTPAARWQVNLWTAAPLHTPHHCLLFSSCSVWGDSCLMYFDSDLTFGWLKKKTFFLSMRPQRLNTVWQLVYLSGEGYQEVTLILRGSLSRCSAAYTHFFSFFFWSSWKEVALFFNRRRGFFCPKEKINHFVSAHSTSRLIYSPLYFLFHH